MKIKSVQHVDDGAVIRVGRNRERARQRQNYNQYVRIDIYDEFSVLFLILIYTRWFILMKRKCCALTHIFIFEHLRVARELSTIVFMHLWLLLFHSQGLKTYAPIRSLFYICRVHICVLYCTLADFSSLGKHSSNMFFFVFFCHLFLCKVMPNE